MIIISITETAVVVEGHAGYDEPGKDIVCAAVSTLAQVLAESLKLLTETKTQCSIEPGKLIIKYRNLSKEAKLLIDSFFIGVRMIADQYPENVTIL